MKVTKSRTALSAFLLVLLSAIPALAADITGTWTSEDKDQDGNAYTITYVFKQDGAKLTGTVATPDESAQLSSGKIDGDKISFSATFSDFTITEEGTIAGDEIKMTIKADDPDFPVHEITLKRSK